MRLALLTYSTRPRGGVVHTLALAESLAARGHDVTVWTLGRGGDERFYRYVDPSVTVQVVPFPVTADETVGERIKRSIHVMAAALGSVSADIVHAQDCISANAALEANHSPIRTIHHLDTFTTPELVACHDRAVHAPAARICVSAAVAAEVHAGWGLDPTVIPNGVDAERFAAAASSPQMAAWRTELGPYVLALGGIEPRKGSIDLLEAWQVLRRHRPDVALVFAGGETLFDYREYRRAFDLRIQQLEPRPIILGPVEEQLLAPLVAGAAALGFVSTKEGFGLAAMEALAAGVPVVARDLPVIREVFGDHVLYGTDPDSFASALERAVSDKGAGEAGRQLAFSHQWRDVAAQHERFYTRVIQSGGDHGASLDLEDPVPAR